MANERLANGSLYDSYDVDNVIGALNALHDEGLRGQLRINDLHWIATSHANASTVSTETIEALKVPDRVYGVRLLGDDGQPSPIVRDTVISSVRGESESLVYTGKPFVSQQNDSSSRRAAVRPAEPPAAPVVVVPTTPAEPETPPPPSVLVTLANGNEHDQQAIDTILKGLSEIHQQRNNQYLLGIVGKLAQDQPLDYNEQMDIQWLRKAKLATNENALAPGVAEVFDLTVTTNRRGQYQYSGDPYTEADAAHRDSASERLGGLFARLTGQDRNRGGRD